MFTLLRLPFVLGILTLLSPDVHQVGIEHRTGTAHEMRLTRTMSMRAGGGTMFVDGHGLPTEDWDVKAWVPDRDDVETVVMRNVVQEAVEGRPVHVVREFVELQMQTTVAGSTTEDTGALEGLKVVLRRDADGEVEATVEGGQDEKVEAPFLEGHLMEHDIHRLLPGDPVELGESWKPEDGALRTLLLAPGPQYYDSEKSAELPGMLEKAAEFEAEMTLLELVKLDGVDCYRLELVVEMQADIDELPAEFTTGDEREEGRLTVKSEQRGELWIAEASHFPLKLEFKSEWTFDIVIDIEDEDEGLEFQFKMELTAENTSSREWEILE